MCTYEEVLENWAGLAHEWNLLFWEGEAEKKSGPRSLGGPDLRELLQ